MIKPYCVSFSGQYSVLAWAESPAKARSMCVGYYTGDREAEGYTTLTARRVPHMTGHPHAPMDPCVMDGSGELPHERELVRLSFIHRCWNCGLEYEDEWPPCDCKGGYTAINRESREAWAGVDWDSQAQLRQHASAGKDRGDE